MNSPLPPPSIEPTLYFFSNSLTVIAIAGAVFFGLGLWFGYLTWGRYKRRARAFQEETNLLRLEIARLKRRIADDVVAVSASPLLEKLEPVVALPAPEPVAMPEEAAPPSPAPSESVSVIAEPPAPLPAPSSEPSAPEPPPASHPEPAARPAVPSPLLTLRALVKAQAQASAVEAPKVVETPEVAATPKAVEPTVVELPGPESSATPAQEVAPAPEAPSAPPPAATGATDLAEAVALELSTPPPLVAEPALPAAPAFNELAGRTFARELKDGEVRHDAVLGMIYAQRPDRWDDLTLMRGVAELTQEKLHDCGIYTFKQIAVWDDRTVREIAHATRLGERISRDRWPQQARDLHYLKYGEKIA